MENIDKLSQLTLEHKNLLKKYDELIQSLSQSDLVEENNKLKEYKQQLDIQLKDLENQLEKLSEENQDIKNSLLDNIINEKLQIISISRKNLDIYFHDKLNPATNRLNVFENEIRNRIDHLIHEIESKLSIDKAELETDVGTIRKKIGEKLEKQRNGLLRGQDDIYRKLNEGMDGFNEEGIDEETIKKRIKQNKIEMKIGLNWLNRIGIVLILISIGLFAYYKKAIIGDGLKSVLFFSLGAVFLVAGEVFHGKDRKYFAQGLTGGGIAVLFAALFSSCFILETLPQNLTLLLSVSIAFLTLILSIRYKSQSIVAVGLIGGYLPFIAYNVIRDFTGADFYYAMAYLFVLNMVTLGISVRMKWTVINYISFLLFLPTSIYLVFNCPSTPVGIVYALLAFLLFMAVVFAHPILNKTKIQIADILLFSINSIASTLVFFLLFEKAAWQNQEGLLSLSLCLVYAGLGRLASKYYIEDKTIFTLSCITSITFAVLIIPFQFEAKWLSMGWLVESILLVVFGINKKMKYMEWAGWLVFGLCLVVFYFYDVPVEAIQPKGYFGLKFFFVTAGLAFIYLAYQTDILKKNTFTPFSNSKRFISALNAIAVVNLFFFTGYVLSKGFVDFIANPVDMPIQFSKFFKLFIWSFSAMAVGRAIQHKKLENKTNQVIFQLLSITAIVLFIYTLSAIKVLPANYQNQYVFLGYLAFAVLIAYNVLIVFNIRQSVMGFFKYNYTSLELLPLLVAVFLLLNISLLIIVQFNFMRTGLFLSISFLILAIGYIVYGFYRRYSYIRYFGLALTFFSIGKLLVFDIKGLDESGKIIAYFSYGVLLIAISFIYQRIQKKVGFKLKEGED